MTCLLQLESLGGGTSVKKIWPVDFLHQQLATCSPSRRIRRPVVVSVGVCINWRRIMCINWCINWLIVGRELFHSQSLQGQRSCSRIGRAKASFFLFGVGSGAEELGMVFIVRNLRNLDIFIAFLGLTRSCRKGEKERRKNLTRENGRVEEKGEEGAGCDFKKK